MRGLYMQDEIYCYNLEIYRCTSINVIFLTSLSICFMLVSCNYFLEGVGYMDLFKIKQIVFLVMFDSYKYG